MAKPVCTFCETNEGVYMGTNLDDGDCQVACGPCLPSFALGMAAAMTAGMPPEVADMYGDAFDAVAANDPRPPKPPATGRKRTKAEGPPPDQATDGSEAASGVSVALPEPCSQCGATTGTGDDVKLTCDGCGAVLATADDAAG